MLSCLLVIASIFSSFFPCHLIISFLPVYVLVPCIGLVLFMNIVVLWSSCSLSLAVGFVLGAILLLPFVLLSAWHNVFLTSGLFRYLVLTSSHQCPIVLYSVRCACCSSLRLSSFLLTHLLHVASVGQTHRPLCVLLLTLSCHVAFVIICMRRMFLQRWTCCFVIILSCDFVCACVCAFSFSCPSVFVSN